MRPNGSHDGRAMPRRAWRKPKIVPLRAKAKPPAAGAAEREPDAPATPSTKLGFAFEMAFPLSARVD